MITLTTPKAVNIVLGSTTMANYDKLVLGPFTMNGVDQTITGTLRMTSTTSPTMQPIMGTVRINVPGGNECVMELSAVSFYRRIVMTSPQANAIIAQIEAAQAQIENGLITLGVIAGVRTAGV